MIANNQLTAPLVKGKGKPRSGAGEKRDSRSRSCGSSASGWNVSESENECNDSLTSVVKKSKIDNADSINNNSVDMNKMDIGFSVDDAGPSDVTLMPPPTTFSVPVKNQFSRLSDCDSDDDNSSIANRVRSKNNRLPTGSKPSDISRTSKATVSVKGQKVPAITITVPPSTVIYATIDEVSKGHLFHARDSVLRVFPSTVDFHTKIIAKLSALSIPFFTHPIKGESSFRSVLFGIPHMKIETIRQQLAEHNIVPVSLDYLLTKEERESHVDPASLAKRESNRLRSYVLEFKSATVTREQVHSVKYINRHICNWRVFKTGGNGPTICNQCCMFGHGQRSCGRIPVCSLCAEAHLSPQCPSAGKGGIKVHRCINCINNNLSSNHVASSPDCPSRELYIAKRRQASDARNKKSSVASNVRQGHKSKSPSVDGYQTKQRIKNLPGHGTSRLLIPQPVTMSNSYADAVKGLRSKASPSQSKPKSLFSIEECVDILFSAIDELQLCQSKFDQLRVLAGLLKQCII